jgi:DNA-directed RNA polymerase subunit N (RpoN/RPB10)
MKSSKNETKSIIKTIPKHTNSSIKSIKVKNEEIKKIVYKKHIYKQFLKMIKDDKFTTAIMSAKILGVERHTIRKWLLTPKISEVMSAKVNQYISRIEQSEDWRANAYLLDKIAPEEKNNPALVQVNNYLDNQNSKYKI